MKKKNGRTEPRNNEPPGRDAAGIRQGNGAAGEGTGGLDLWDHVPDERVPVIREFARGQSLLPVRDSRPPRIRNRSPRRRKTGGARSVFQVLLFVVPATVLVVLFAFFGIPWLTGGFPANPTPTGTPSDSPLTPDPSGMPSLTPGTTEAPTAQPTPTEGVPPSPTPDPAVRAARYEALKADVAALLDQAPGRYALTYLNPVSGEDWGYQDTAPFVAASSIKLGINTYLYSQVAAGAVSLDEILAYDNRAYPTGDFEAGTGIIQGMANGSEFTVRETSRLSITVSDNCATNMVIRRLGGIDAVNGAFLKKIGPTLDYRGQVSYSDYRGEVSSGRHRTCSRDLALHARELYRLWARNPEVYDPLVDDLCNTEFGFGLHTKLPEYVRVAHKIGTNAAYHAENDVAIVFAEEPFILCILTESGDAVAARELAADIARMFYDYIAEFYP